MLEDWMHDLRLAARSLRSTPAFALVATATLALGLGFATAMFSALDGLLLRPLPYPEPQRLVAVFETDANGAPTPVSLLTVGDWERQLDGIDAVGGYRRRSFLAAHDSTDRRFVVQTAMATAGFLPALGDAVDAGRSFTGGEERAEARVIVLGAAAATRLFGTASAALGNTVRLNDVPYAVIGVLRSEFEFPIDGYPVEAVIPVSHADYGRSRAIRSLRVVARLHDEAPAGTLEASLATAAIAATARHPETHADRGAATQSLHATLRGGNRAPLALLGVAAAILLLTACSNVAALTLQRHSRDLHDLGVRLSLGAASRHLARRAVSDAAVLTALGLALGWTLASWILALLPRALAVLGGEPAALRMSSALPRLDPSAFGFAAATAAGVALTLALVPTLLARRADPLLLLNGHTREAGSSRRGRTLLVVGQVALSAMLLLSTGLLLRSFAVLVTTDPGFDDANVARFGIGIPEARYDTEAKMIAFHRDLSRQLQSVPVIESAAVTAALPLGGRSFGTWFAAAHDETAIADRARARLEVVAPGFFAALGIPVRRGRSFTWADDPDARRVLLVNDAGIRAFGKADDTLGQQLQVGWRSEINPPGTAWTVVGVVGNVRHRSLAAAAEPTIYLPASQYPLDGGTYVVRAAAIDAALAAAIRAAVTAVDPGVQRVDVSGLGSQVDRSLDAERRALGFAALFGAVALVLTGLGIFGVVAVEVTRRRHEMAVRRALGASAASIGRLVLAIGARSTGLGILLGLLGFAWVGQLLRSLLHGVAVLDPLTIAAAALVLLAMAVGAGTIPAWRAVRAAPMESIKSP